MSNVVVTDTGPLIALALVDMLPILPRLFSTVYVPNAVINEATQDATNPGAAAMLDALDQRWIIQRSADLSEAYTHLIEILDQGEAEALALAEHLDALALVEERRGRNVAIRRGIKVTGTAAVLVKSKHCGEIELVGPLLNRLTQYGYRFSPSLLRDVLKLSGE